MTSNQDRPSPPAPGAPGDERATLLSRGLERFKAGDIDGAETAFRRALDLDGGDADALHFLGLSQHRRGDFAAAIDSINKALAAAGPNPVFLNNLGQIQSAAGRAEDAVESYRTILTTDPGHVEARTNMANALVSLGRIEEAVAAYDAAIAANPSFAPAQYNLGTLYIDMDRAEDAVPCLEAAAQIAPDFLAAHINLGSAHLTLGDAEKAAGCFERALAIDGRCVDALKNLGAALLEMNRANESVERLQRALAIDPGRADVTELTGSAYRALGRFEEAEAAFRRVLDLRPGHTKAYLLLGDMKRYGEDDADIEAMEKLRAGDALADGERIDLLYALAKAYDDVGSVDRAFSRLKEANDGMRRTVDFDLEEQRAYHDGLKQMFSAATLTALGGHGNPSETPVFVVGLPRSGSTMVEQILASHPRVHGAGERRDMVEIAHRFLKSLDDPPDVSAITGAIEPGDLRSLGGDYVAKLSKHADGAQRIVDKQLQNYKNIGLINLLLPNARIVHCRRHPVATCFSCYQHRFIDPQRFTYDLAELGAFFGLYADLMAHWHAVSAVPILDLAYEDLVTGQEAETRRLLEFCGLEWDAACLDFHKTDRAVRTASLVQVRRPVFTSSLDRWQGYREHLSPLLDALGPLAAE